MIVGAQWGHQLSLDHSRKKLFPPGQVLPIHGSLTRKQGVGERHKSSRLGACCTSGPFVQPSCCNPNPSLARQASCTLPRAEELANHRVKFQVSCLKSKRGCNLPDCFHTVLSLAQGSI